MMKKALDCIELALKINETTEHDVFIRVHPHIDSVEFDIHEGGWISDEYPTLSLAIQRHELTSDEVYEKLEEWL